MPKKYEFVNCVYYMSPLFTLLCVQFQMVKQQCFEIYADSIIFFIEDVII